MWWCTRTGSGVAMEGVVRHHAKVWVAMEGVVGIRTESGVGMEGVMGNQDGI